MDKNIRIAKELVKIAKSLVASASDRIFLDDECKIPLGDETFDFFETHLPRHSGVIRTANVISTTEKNGIITCEFTCRNAGNIICKQISENIPHVSLTMDKQTGIFTLVIDDKHTWDVWKFYFNFK